MSIAYVVMLVLVLLAIKIAGERYWLSSAALYLPPLGWLLPLAVLTPLCFLHARRSCWFHLIAVITVLFVFMDFHWKLWTPAKKKSLTIVTNNIGSRKAQTLFPFLEGEKPDIIVLQEAWRLAPMLSRRHPNFFVAQRSEFVLLSKFEIKNSGVVPGSLTPRGYLAAWFELNYHGKSILVYAVHLPTPRFDLERLRGRGFVVELLRGGGLYSTEGRVAFAKAMDERIQAAEKLMEVLQKEERPFLVAGDFNAPSPGYVKDIFASNLTDVFAAAGRGYGLTFPGSTWNPLSLFGPWLRIDYIFAGKGWRPISCEVEPRQSAQHLGIAATVELEE